MYYADKPEQKYGVPVWPLARFNKNAGIFKSAHAPFLQQIFIRKETASKPFGHDRHQWSAGLSSPVQGSKRRSPRRRCLPDHATGHCDPGQS